MRDKLGRFEKGFHSSPKTEFKKGHKLSEKTKQKMRESRKLEKHPQWKGGRTKDKDGYILVKKPSHPFCNPCGYIREHRIIMEKHIGRYLKREEVVHHKGIKYPIDSIENKQDNRIENLELFINDIEHLKCYPSERNKLGQFT